MAEPTYTKLKLSGSTNGKQIIISTITNPGTLIHTAVAGIVDYDEIYLYITNNHTAALSAVVLWGGVATPNDYKQLSVPSKQGDFLIVPGHILQNGLEVRIFAETANLLCVSGWVNRITN